jgi:polysaccharide export outer membrane protein
MIELAMRVLGLLGSVLLPGSGILAQVREQVAAPAATPIAEATTNANVRDTQRPTPTERHLRYQICRDDILVLSFPLSPELNQKVMVQPDGFISLQGVGSVYVAGLTIPSLIEAVKSAYAKTLHDPIVDVDLADFQKPFFTVLGQVGKPGQYDLRYDITVTQAVAIAGGFASTAKTQVFLYRSVSSNWAEVRELKIKDILHGRNISEDVHLRPGDMIFVPEKAITKFQRYVPYNVALNPYTTHY